MELKREQILEAMDNKHLVHDDYETIIEFVLELMEDRRNLAKEHEPNAIISIGRMESAIHEIKNLRGLTDIDVDCEWIMDKWSLEESEVDEIIRDLDLVDYGDMRRLIELGKLHYYGDEYEFFYDIHKDLNMNDLIRMLYDDTTNKDDVEYTRLSTTGDYIWKDE